MSEPLKPKARQPEAVLARAAAPAKRPRALWLMGGMAVVVAVGAVAWWWAGSARPGSSAATGPPGDILLSVPEWLAGHSTEWRVGRLQENRSVLVVEFPSLAEQGAAMNRIAALLEKADAPRDRVLDDSELAALIARSGDTSQTFYQGHDYDGAGLARFYGLVQQQRQALNPQEARMRQVLLDRGLIVERSDGSVTAQGVQAVITFTAVQADDPATPADETIDERRRDSVLRHEISHGLFYTRPAYREHCRQFWRQTLDEAQREGIRRYLATLGYDRRDEDLMLNEAQAFLMHTPDVRAFDAPLIGMPPAVLSDLRTLFWRSMPPLAQEPGDRGTALHPALHPIAPATLRPPAPGAASGP